MSDIKVVNSGPDTIKVTVSETPKVNVSVPDNSVISIEPGITSAERNKLAGIEAGATADQVLTAGDNIVLSSGPDYTISLVSSPSISGNLAVAGTSDFNDSMYFSGQIFYFDRTGSGSVSSQSIRKNTGDFVLESVAGDLSISASENISISNTSSSGDITINSRGNATLRIDGGSEEGFYVYDDRGTAHTDPLLKILRYGETSITGIQNNVLFRLNTTRNTDFPESTTLNSIDINPTDGGYSLPVIDGSANTFLQTDGAGSVTFVAPTLSDLSDSSNVVTLDGAQTITGNKTFSGTTTLSGALSVISGNLLATGSVTVSNQNLTISGTGALSVAGTSSFSGAATFNSTLTAGSLNFIGNGTSIIAPTTIGALIPDDLEIRSNGNVVVKLDYDNDESSQKFQVANNSGTERFSVDEDGTVTVNSAFSFPTSDGTTGQVMTTNGSGTLSWSSPVASIEDLSDVNIIGTPSQGDVLTYNSGSSQWMKSSSLQDLLGIVKSSSGTQVYNTSLDTSAGYVDLQSTSAKMGLGGTFLTASQTSPGVLTFSVATGASGTETQFDAFTLTGTTTTDVADLLLEPGCNFKIEATSGGDAQIRNYPSNTADTTITLPQSSGTLATTADVPTSIDDLSDVDTSTVAPTDGQALVWDNTAGKWEPGTVSGGSSPWTTSGSDIYYTTGNVGIGTTSPLYTLHVDDGAVNSDTLFVNSYNRIGWTGGAKQYMSGWSGRLAFQKGSGGEWGRFSYSGDVNRLVVSRALHLAATSGDNGDVRFTRLSTGKVAIGDSADDASGTLVVGNVGIGTTTPAETLDVSGRVNINDGSNNVLISTGNSTITATNTTALGYQAGTALTTGGSNILIGYQAGSTLTTESNKLYIENSNSTTPLVYGEFDNDLFRINGDIQVGKPESNATDRSLIVSGYSAAKIGFNLHNGWGKPEMSAEFNGTVKFVNNGNNSSLLTFQFGESASRQGAMKFFSSSNDAIKFGTNAGYPIAYIGPNEEGNNYTGGLLIKTRNGVSNTNDFYFSKSGYFGIGTKTPSKALDVSGDANISGSLEVIAGVTADEGGLTTAGDYGKGAEVWYQGTSTPTAGSVYYLDSSGNWANTDASAESTAKGMVAVSAGTDSDVDGMVIKGFVYLGTDPGGSIGDVVYLSETANQLTTTAPTTSSAVVRIVGYKVATNIVYFNPSHDYIVLA